MARCGAWHVRPRPRVLTSEGALGLHFVDIHSGTVSTHRSHHRGLVGRAHPVSLTVADKGHGGFSAGLVAAVAMPCGMRDTPGVAWSLHVSVHPATR